jgi:ABC-type multidrug transport system ATPase subunit
MIGLYPPTSGSAYVHGKSIRGELSSIHTMMGVCTQYDILWETMTGREHLQFFGKLRNLQGKVLEEMSDAILKRFNLYEARNVVAGKYSGGMKRRLSVAIALLGRPKIICKMQ